MRRKNKMKILSKIALIFIFGGIVFFNTTCTKQKWFASVTYEGHVYDHSGNPASGISVVLNACMPTGVTGDQMSTCDGHNHEFEVGRTSTDASGHFRIHEKAARSGNYFVAFNGIGWNMEGVGEETLNTSKYTQLHLP